MEASLNILKIWDGVLGSLASQWKDEDGLVLVTSDHGNMEDLSTRRHTANPVPCLLFGSLENRRRFADGLADIAGLGRRVKEFLRQDPNP
jgi:bisphosphoglycerate-independent phosphoglycerate mutase (AlkP superfamily)